LSEVLFLFEVILLCLDRVDSLWQFFYDFFREVLLFLFALLFTYFFNKIVCARVRDAETHCINILMLVFIKVME
jgi:hypothetical protein